MQGLTPASPHAWAIQTLSLAMEATRLARLAAEALPASPAQANSVAHLCQAQEVQEALRQAMSEILKSMEGATDVDAQTPGAVPQVRKHRRKREVA